MTWTECGDVARFHMTHAWDLTATDYEPISMPEWWPDTWTEIVAGVMHDYAEALRELAK